MTADTGGLWLACRSFPIRQEAAPVERLGSILRLALWLAAVVNGAVVVSILVSLYHARMTWVVVGLLLAAGLSLVAAACVRQA